MVVDVSGLSEAMPENPATEVDTWGSGGAGEVVPGFAVTVHSAQGATAEKSILVADENTNGNMLYVGVSRAKSEARVVFAGDLNREDPRVAQWENDRRKAEMAGEEFARPFPAAEKIKGLWQLANCWARSGASEMATHQAQRAGLVVTQADLDRSRTILSAGGGEVSEDAVRVHAEAAAQRRVEAAKRQAVMRAREEGAERFSDVGLRIARDLKGR